MDNLFNRFWEREHDGTGDDVSRPLVPTFPIQTGPHSHERYGHFASGDRPALDRFDTMGFTPWAGHVLPLNFASATTSHS